MSKSFTMNIPVQSDWKALRYERVKISSPCAWVSANRLDVQNGYCGFGQELAFGYDRFQRIEDRAMLVRHLAQLPVNEWLLVLDIQL
jgi:hypothetical protein